MNSKRCLDRSRETKRTGSVRFMEVSQIVLRGALLEWGKNKELEMSGSALVVSLLEGRYPPLQINSVSIPFKRFSVLVYDQKK
jgi:hypothetical protein